MTNQTRDAMREAVTYLRSQNVVCVDGAYAVAAAHPLIDGELMHAPDTPAQHKLVQDIHADEDRCGQPRSHIGFVIPID